MVREWYMIWNNYIYHTIHIYTDFHTIAWTDFSGFYRSYICNRRLTIWDITYYMYFVKKTTTKVCLDYR